jgi:hypothetical protein
MALPPEVFDRLHGAIRSLQAARDGAPARRAKPAPEDETLRIGNTEVSKGARVRLKPKRRADSMDLFLAGMTARVEGVYRDVDDRTWVAVTVEDDPAADMHTWYGRFLYFYPDEIEPLGVSTPPLAHERKAEP